MIKKQVYAGLALGFLTGTIIGLSIAEVTGIILGALVSLLAAFFGLRPSQEGETGNHVAIGTFSVACVFAILFGIYTRTHNLLSPTLADEIRSFRQISDDDAEIKKLILFKQLGLLPENYTFTKDAVQLSRNTILMTGESSSTYLCASITENSSLADLKAAYKSSGGRYNEIQKRLSEAIKDPEELRKTLVFFKTLICEQSN